MSTRFATGSLNGLLFTHTGAEGGDPLKCLVKGEPRFASTLAANSVLAADASVHTQAIDRGVRGNEFDLNFPYIPETLLALIMVEINVALVADATVRIVIDSQVDFDVEAQIVFQDGAPYTYEARSGGVAQNVTFRFIATGPGEEDE